MRKWLRRGAGRREGAIDGINLFFGALLGANLGTLEGLKLVTYVQLVTILAGTVIALRVVSTAERRGSALAVLGAYALLLVGLVTVPDMQPRGLSEGALHRLVATLAVWLIFVLAIELAPGESKQRPEAAGNG